MGGIKAGVVVASDFVMPGNEVFGDYIKYMSRPGAIRNQNFKKYVSPALKEHLKEFDGYVDYMANPQKTTGLFTEALDEMTSEQSKQLQNLFCQAQDNESPMWQTIISFDNRWLEKNGIYDQETRTINESKLRECTRGCMRNMLNQENMADDSVWTASVHYNTDNIHIHVATVQPVPSRPKIQSGPYAGQYRGKLRLSSIQEGKKFVVNNIMNMSPSHEKMNHIIRDIMKENISNSPLYEDPTFCAEFLKIYKKLPDNKYFWRYATMPQKLKPALNHLIQHYVDTYYPDEFKELVAAAREREALYKEAYGGNSNSIVENTINDMYYRLGNPVLNQMRSFSRMEKQYEKQHENRPMLRGIRGELLNSVLRVLRRNLNNEFEHYKNQQMFQEQERAEERAKRGLYTHYDNLQ